MDHILGAERQFKDFTFSFLYYYHWTNFSKKKKTQKTSLLIMSSQRSRLTLKNETKFLLSFNESKSKLENFIRFVIISKHVKFMEHFLQYLAAKNKSIFGS